jgi:hypothetical protein
LRRGVTAPAAVVTAVVASDALSAAVPPQLAAISIQSATAFVTAGESAAALVSPTGASLMRALLLKMFLYRLWTTTAVMASLVLMLGGAGAIWQRMASAEIPSAAPVGLADHRIPSAVAAPAASPVPAPQPTPDKPAIRLPTDANVVVLRMDRSVDSPARARLLLEIYADGRVVAEVPDELASLSATDLTRHAKGRAIAADADGHTERQKTKVLNGRLSVGDLEELLRFALHDQEFFDFDAVDIEAAIWEEYQSDGNVSDANDATTTSFRVQTADSSHEVSQFGSYFGNNSRFDDARVDFYDVNGVLIDSVTATVPLSRRDWTWNGWESAVPIKSLMITGNDTAFLNGFIWFDDMQVNPAVAPVPEPSSLLLLGLSGLIVTLVHSRKLFRPRTRTSRGGERTLA